MSQTSFIKSGIPGVFYRKPAPDQPNYAEDGAQLAAGQTIGLVEIMKSFHPVVAEEDCRLMKFLVDDLAEVGPGQDIAEIDVS